MIKVEKYFSNKLDIPESKLVNVEIKNQNNGEIIYKQDNVEAPKHWSTTAINTTASKYFYGRESEENKETSVYSLVDRVVSKLENVGIRDKYFSKEDGSIFKEELRVLLLNQYIAFNSPVFFSFGNPHVKEQMGSACFINKVEDNLESITDLVKTEATIFKHGAGSGVSLTPIRSSWEHITGGGWASGPLSWERIYDQNARAWKSGGVTRRAARIRNLSCYHGDVLNVRLETGEEGPGFVKIKGVEEDFKTKFLEADLSSGMDGEATDHTHHQSANFSVMVDDDFMNAVALDETIQLRKVTETTQGKQHPDGEVLREVRAKEVFDAICKSAWKCGDPGLQYGDTIKEFDTCTNDDSGEIVASNPCQPGFAPIITPEGIKTFDDIDIGSTIWSEHGWTTVTRKWSNGIKPVYRYETVNSYFIGTEDHKVFSKGKLVKVKNAEMIDYCQSIFHDIKYTAEPVPLLVENTIYVGEFEVFDITVDNEDHSYWSGNCKVSNCSEFIFKNNTACNLGAVNLLKFADPDSFINLEDYRKVVRLMTIALDIVVSASNYPTKEIQDTVLKYRTIGLGFSNFGGLLLSLGIPYSSYEAKEAIFRITSEMFFNSIKCSIELSKELGTFPNYEVNKKSVLDVIHKHIEFYYMDSAKYLHTTATEHFKISMKDIITNIKTYGLRNAQVTVVQPGGTTSFFMDCVTTGIEPVFSFGALKYLAGGGQIDYDFPILKEALETFLNNKINKLVRIKTSPPKNIYDALDNIDSIVEYVSEHGTVVGNEFEDVTREFLKTAVDPGGNELKPIDHINIVAEAQKYISGAISKTINVPSNYTPEDIGELYFRAWDLGCKSISVYRDGSKDDQPVKIKNNKEEEINKPVQVFGTVKDGDESPIRARLPMERNSSTRKFDISGHDFYITCSWYPDTKKLAEVFINTSKAGTFISGVCDAFATVLSISLQYGIPLEKISNKLKGMSFDPSGFTGQADIPYVKSFIDAIFLWLEQKQNQLLEESDQENLIEELEEVIPTKKTTTNFYSGEICVKCGGMMIQSGTCQTCSDCGNTSGGCG